MCVLMCSFCDLLGKRDYGCHPTERGGEKGGKEKKGNGQTGVCRNLFMLFAAEKQLKMKIRLRTCTEMKMVS